MKDLNGRVAEMVNFEYSGLSLLILPSRVRDNYYLDRDASILVEKYVA